jgi:hypothetical protein
MSGKIRTERRAITTLRPVFLILVHVPFLVLVLRRRNG